MFLLIPLDINIFKACQWPLHSTMFLLILNTKKITVLDSAFTFHYVSINTAIADTMKTEGTPLHSTMFLLILHDRRPQSRRWKTLHSTMFLLILPSSFFPENMLLSLHSTMFLLILEPGISIWSSMRSLHSTMFLLILAIRWPLSSICNVLYIPLCFY